MDSFSTEQEAHMDGRREVERLTQVSKLNRWRKNCQIHRDENGDVFVLIDGMKIAKRGQPDTPHADTWIMLEPGWIVRDVKGGKAIEVRYERARMH
jgi:hypothetical protein